MYRTTFFLYLQTSKGDPFYLHPPPADDRKRRKAAGRKTTVANDELLLFPPFGGGENGSAVSQPQPARTGLEAGERHPDDDRRRGGKSLSAKGSSRHSQAAGFSNGGGGDESTLQSALSTNRRSESSSTMTHGTMYQGGSSSVATYSTDLPSSSTTSYPKAAIRSGKSSTATAAVLKTGRRSGYEDTNGIKQRVDHSPSSPPKADGDRDASPRKSSRGDEGRRSWSPDAVKATAKRSAGGECEAERRGSRSQEKSSQESETVPLTASKFQFFL